MALKKPSKEDPQQYVLKKNYKKAIEIYLSLIEESPGDPKRRLRLGDCLALDEQIPAAIVEYKKAARIFADQGFLLKAIGVNKTITRLDPSQEEVHERLSKLYEERGLLAGPSVAAPTTAPPGSGFHFDMEAEADDGVAIDLGLSAAPAGADLPSLSPMMDEPGAAVAGPEPESDVSVDDLDFGSSVPESAQHEERARAVAEPEAELSALDFADSAEEPAEPAAMDFAPDLDPPVQPVNPVPSFREVPSFGVVSDAAGSDAPAMDPDGPLGSFDFALSSPEPAPVPVFGHVSAPFGEVSAPAAVAAQGSAAMASAGFDFAIAPANDSMAGGEDQGQSEDFPEEVSLDDLSDALGHMPVVSAKPPLAEGLGFDLAPDAESELAGIDDLEPGMSSQELQRTPLFSDLTAPEFVEVVKEMGQGVYDKDAVVFREGDPGDALFVIVTGSVRVVTSAKGSELKLADLGEGEFFGEGALITGRPRTATILANEESELLSLSKVALDAIVAKHPRVGDVMKDFYQKRAENTVKAILRSGRK